MCIQVDRLKAFNISFKINGVQIAFSFSIWHPVKSVSFLENVKFFFNFYFMSSFLIVEVGVWLWSNSDWRLVVRLILILNVCLFIVGLLLLIILRKHFWNCFYNSVLKQSFERFAILTGSVLFHKLMFSIEFLNGFSPDFSQLVLVDKICFWTIVVKKGQCRSCYYRSVIQCLSTTYYINSFSLVKNFCSQIECTVAVYYKL